MWNIKMIKIISNESVIAGEKRKIKLNRERIGKHNSTRQTFK